MNRYLHSSVRSSIVPKSQNVEATQVPTDRWVDKQMWAVYTMEYYSALKQKGILTHATPWVNLEDIMLGE